MSILLCSLLSSAHGSKVTRILIAGGGKGLGSRLVISCFTTSPEKDTFCLIQSLFCLEAGRITIDLLVTGLATAHVMRILRVYVDVTILVVYTSPSLSTLLLPDKTTCSSTCSRRNAKLWLCFVSSRAAFSAQEGGVCANWSVFCMSVCSLPLAPHVKALKTC